MPASSSTRSRPSWPTPCTSPTTAPSSPGPSTAGDGCRPGSSEGSTPCSTRTAPDATGSYVQSYLAASQFLRGRSVAEAPADPKVPGREPVFRHLDDPDVTWQQVKRQRNADGSEAAVWEKWLAFSPEPQYLSLYAKYDPGMIVRRHGHYSPHIVFVLEGSLFVGDRACPAGTHVELPLGAAFGPLRAGEH